MKTINDTVRATEFRTSSSISARMLAWLKRSARKQLRAKERQIHVRIDALAELKDYRQDLAVKPPKLRVVRKSAEQIAQETGQYAQAPGRAYTLVGDRAIASVSSEFLKAA